MFHANLQSNINKNIATAIKSWPGTVLSREGGGRPAPRSIWHKDLNAKTEPAASPSTQCSKVTVGLSCLVFEIWRRDGQQTDGLMSATTHIWTLNCTNANVEYTDTNIVRVQCERWRGGGVVTSEGIKPTQTHASSHFGDWP